MPAEYVPTADQRTLAENAAAFGRPQWRQRTLSRLGFHPRICLTRRISLRRAGALNEIKQPGAAPIRCPAPSAASSSTHRARCSLEMVDTSDKLLEEQEGALIVLDPDLRVIAASRSFYQTFGVNPQDTKASCSTTSITGNGTFRRFANSSRKSFRSIAPSRATRSNTSFRPSDGAPCCSTRARYAQGADRAV
jgi:hypothetical protein